MKNVFFVFATFALLFSACKKDGDSLPEKTIQLNDTVTIGFNQTAILEPDELKITFTGITEDSRCPINAFCFWAGRVVANFKVEKGANEVLGSLTPTPQEDSLPSNKLTAFNRTVQLLEVTPYPENVNAIPAGDYKVRIVVK